MKCRFSLSAALVALSLSLPCARADDWPELMGPKRRGISLETEWNVNWTAKEPPVAWKVQVGIGSSSIAAVNGRVYTMGGHREGRESVICLDAATGREYWRQEYDCPFDKRMFEGGTAATPVVDNGKVYTLSYLGALYCWDATTGEKVWERNLETDFKGVKPRWGWAGSPLVVGNMLIVEPGGNGSSVAALDKLTGATFWQRGSDPAAYGSPVIFSAPSLMRGVALFNETGLVGINPKNGAELFRQAWKTDFGVNAGLPLQADGRFFLCTGYGMGAGLVDLTSGAPRLAWKSGEATAQFQSGVLLDGNVYLVSGDSSTKSELKCIDFATGAVRWSERVGTGKIGHVIAAGGRLIVTPDSGEVLLVEASPKAYRELGSIHPLTGKVWAAPAFSDSRLFIRNNGGTFICLDLKP